MQTYFFILYFFTYGFFGWCTEVAYAATQQRKFVNRGFLNGPICPVYGIGVGVVVQFLTPFENNLFLLYITSIIVVTVIEGLTGYLMDKLFHHKWWDYTNQPLNIGGYVCLLFSLAWGVACVIIVKVIHPFIHKAVSVPCFRNPGEAITEAVDVIKIYTGQPLPVYGCKCGNTIIIERIPRDKDFEKACLFIPVC